jgi:hypothetical protein
MYTQRNKLSKEIQDLERLVKVLKCRLEEYNKRIEIKKSTLYNID